MEWRAIYWKTRLEKFSVPSSFLLRSSVQFQYIFHGTISTCWIPPKSVVRSFHFQNSWNAISNYFILGLPTSPLSNPVICPSNPISSSVYVSKLLITGSLFGRNKIYPPNSLKNPSPSPGLINHTAVTTSTSHDSASTTLDSLTLISSPTHPPPLSMRTLRTRLSRYSQTYLNVLLLQPYVSFTESSTPSQGISLQRFHTHPQYLFIPPRNGFSLTHLTRSTFPPSP